MERLVPLVSEDSQALLDLWADLPVHKVLRAIRAYKGQLVSRAGRVSQDPQDHWEDPLAAKASLDPRARPDHRVNRALAVSRVPLQP